MEQSKIDMFFLANAKYFSPEQIPAIRAQLEKADDTRFAMLQAIGYKDPSTILIVSILVGNLGVDRFMLGDTGLGIAKLLTCGGFGIWTIVDLFTVMGRSRDYNFNKIQLMLA